MTLPNLCTLSDKQLATLRSRIATPVKLSDERLGALAQIIQEYKRRGYTATEFAYLPTKKSGPELVSSGPDYGISAPAGTSLAKFTGLQGDGESQST